MVHTHETIERVAHGDDETIELHIGAVEFLDEKIATRRQ